MRNVSLRDALTAAVAEAAIAAAPLMLCQLRVKNTARISGICTVQMLDVSLTPVRLSIRI